MKQRSSLSRLQSHPPPTPTPTPALLLLDFFGSASCGPPGSRRSRTGLERRLIGPVLHPARLRLLLARTDNKPQNISLKVFTRRLPAGTI